MDRITQQTVRDEAAKLAALLLEITAGLWVLLLFILALAWDPLDRRLGFRARRHAERPTAAESTSAHTAGAYVIGAAPGPAPVAPHRH